jgi:exodeoxyribonuclease V gamma subunit
LNEGDPRTVYEGGFELSGEVDDPCLARLWPDFAALTSSGEWPALAEQLYGGLVNWLERHVQVTKLDGEQA